MSVAAPSLPVVLISQDYDDWFNARLALPWGKQAPLRSRGLRTPVQGLLYLSGLGAVSVRAGKSRGVGEPQEATSNVAARHSKVADPLAIMTAFRIVSPPLLLNASASWRR